MHSLTARAAVRVIAALISSQSQGAAGASSTESGIRFFLIMHARFYVLMQDHATWARDFLSDSFVRFPLVPCVCMELHATRRVQIVMRERG